MRMSVNNKDYCDITGLYPLIDIVQSFGIIIL